MLLNCPKCGFSQPQDKYCAKCGVDMESFQPTELSWLSRVLLHPAVHISSIIILVIIAVTYIQTKNREKQNFLSQVERLQNGPVIIERSQTEPSAQPSEAPSPVPTGDEKITDKQADKQTEKQNEKPSDDPNLKLATARDGAKSAFLAGSAGNETSGSVNSSPSLSGSQQGGSAADSAGTAKTPSKGSLRVRVIFAEIDTTTLDRWAQKMQANGQFSHTDFRMGVLPKIEKEMAADRSIVTLDRVEKIFEPGSEQEWFNGKTNRDQSLGFKTSLGIAASDRDVLRGELKVVRNLDPGDPRTFEAEFEAPPQAGWVFADILSRQYRPEPEDETNPVSFFQIFSSPRFKSLRTQFAILFLFDRPSAAPATKEQAK